MLTLFYIFVAVKRDELLQVLIHALAIGWWSFWWNCKTSRIL